MTAFSPLVELRETGCEVDVCSRRRPQRFRTNRREIIKEHQDRSDKVAKISNAGWAKFSVSCWIVSCCVYVCV